MANTLHASIFWPMVPAYGSVASALFILVIGLVSLTVPSKAVPNAIFQHRQIQSHPWHDDRGSFDLHSLYLNSNHAQFLVLHGVPPAS